MSAFDPTAFADDHGRWLRVHYRHRACGTRWTCEWSCACDDDCPSCGATCEALDWDNITSDHQDALAALLRRRGVNFAAIGALDAGEASAEQIAAAQTLLDSSRVAP